MFSGFGPIKVKPDSSTIFAKSEFSDKNPAGCIASAPVTSAALIIDGIFRYDKLDCAGPTHTDSSARSTLFEFASSCGEQPQFLYRLFFV